MFPPLDCTCLIRCQVRYGSFADGSRVSTWGLRGERDITVDNSQQKVKKRLRVPIQTFSRVSEKAHPRSLDTNVGPFPLENLEQQA